MKNILLLFLTISILSCNSQEKKREIIKIESSEENLSNSQIGEYVVETFQDSKGNLWFGTLEEGVAKYDGENLIYLTIKDGLPSDRVVEIVEDTLGNLWFGTDKGISKFDGTTFTTYSEKEGLCSNMVSNLFLDSKGIFWIGTWGGVSKFDGNKFENFNIPYPKIDTKINPDTKDWITAIAEDSKGNIWFGRDGYGASKFDGKSFVHYTTKEGLNSNNVQTIVEDNEGNIWMGTRVAEKDNENPDKRFGKGGLNKFNGKEIIHFTNLDGLYENDVYAIFKDHSNDLWIGTTKYGVYQYKNNEYVNFKVPKSTMSFLKDISGNIWLGCAGGLYRINPNGEIVNITTKGPWK